MYAFRLSGEKAAAVAPLIWKVVTVRELEVQLVQIKSRFGESVVSEITTELLSGEVARTFPGALSTWLTEVPLKTMSPCCRKSLELTPRKAVPAVSKTKELGVDASAVGPPAVKGEVAEALLMGTNVGVQVAVVVLQPVVVA